MYTDAMLDIETLGTAPGSVITSVGLVFFNRADPEDGAHEDYRWTVDIRPQMKAGLRVDGDTLYWWMSQDREATKAWAGDVDRIGPTRALGEIATAFRECAAAGCKVWANSPSFDCVLMETLWRVFDVPCPWDFRAQADTRTLLLVAPVEKVRPEVEHDALSDALAQARTVQRAWASLDAHA